VLAPKIALCFSNPIPICYGTNTLSSFKTLFAGEAFLIALLLFKYLDAPSSGFSSTTLVTAAGSLVPYLFWRIWALMIQPELLSSNETARGKVERKVL
jgi:hypothetical protein